MDKSVVLAFLLTSIAGISTGIGSAIAFFSKGSSKRFLSASLGFSAGVMIYISFVDLFTAARDKLAEVEGRVFGNWLAVVSFFGGIVVIALIDHLVPSYENPHEVHTVEKLKDRADQAKLMRMGVFTSLAIAVHNFPEGLATFVATLSDPAIGVSIMIAIALHNIPEGISVSVPVYYATGSKTKAFWLSFLSGLSEPLGAFAGYLILRPFFSETVFGLLFAFVAGIMVFISLDELLPTAKEYDEGHAAIYGLTAGMAIMAFSLLLFT